MADNNIVGAELTMSLDAAKILVMQGLAGKAPRINLTNFHWEIWSNATQSWVDTGISAVNGAPGADGADGVSPVITVSSITGGHRLTITDAEHPSGQTVDVMNGEDGYTPTISAVQQENGVLITISDGHPHGTINTYFIPNGQDYVLTNADKQEIADLLIGNVPQLVTDWMDANISAETTVVIDASLSIEGAAADAKATGDVVEHIGLETVYTGIESDAPNIPLNYSANRTAAGITSQIGKYYSNTTGELLDAGNGSYYSLFRYKPGSVFKADYGINFVFFDVNKHFNYSVPAVSEGAQDITAPGTEGYVGISCQSSYGLGLDNIYARWVYTNFLVTGIDYKISAQTDWERVYNKRSVEEAVDNVQNLSAAFDVYEINAGGGKIRPVRFGKTYASNPYINTGAGQSIGVVTFYNANKNPIANPTGIGTGGNGTAGWSNRTVNGLTQLTIAPGTRFSISGTTISSNHMYGSPKSANIELPETPAYIKIVSSTRWTVGVYSTEIPDGQVVCLYNTEKSSGFAEQMTELVGDSIAAGTGPTAAVLKSQNIMTVNRMRHAFRVGSFNIYGAGYNQRNWSAVKDMLQFYGIDFIGFQEVYQPNSTNSEGKTFQQALTSWQFTQFAVIQTEDVPGNCRPVAATSDFEVIGITEVKYTQQSNYGHRHYTRTELQLPKWKDKKWSEYLRVSVYNTQLEVGTSSANTQTRLAQAAELIAAMSADANPFVVLVGDFNEMSPNFSTRQAFVDAGFTPALPDESTCTTAGSSRGYYDNIFVNDRIQIVGNDVVPSDKYKFENGTLNISDHDLVITDIIPDYTNIITVKKNDTQNHCTISGVGNWLDRRQTEPVAVTITPDSGYTFKSVTMYQGDNDVDYGTNPFVISGNTVTIYPNRIVGDIVIAPTCEAEAT